MTVLLTGGAFWLSYEHLHDTAAANGLSGARAWAWPGTIDLFIIVGELLMLRASLLRRTDGWAVGLTASGSLGSIALNIAGVGEGSRPLEYVVAAVPPVAALLAFGALMRQVHQRLTAPPVPDVSALVPESDADVPATVEPAPAAPASVPVVPEPAPVGVRLLPLVARPERAPEGDRAPEVLAEPEPVPVATKSGEAVPEVVPEAPADPEPDTERLELEWVEPHDNSPAPPAEDSLTADARQRFAAFVEQGRPVPYRQLREAYGIGQQRAERIREELLQTLVAT
ncbi:DUF2637 domain-containing protein [Streptomyces buecherae]|uniref:DUF2637 domain-containing protein n=1 Tax=Streptomyces buecherae TaxID=2763006 RepID=UPI0027E2D475|nr:DUF2637 domain-containing protein [Streptomyces buecherae]